MFILGNLVRAIAEILGMVINLYLFLVVGRAVISWVSPDPYNPIVQFLYRATEPALAPIRRRIGIIGGLDVSPLVLMLGLAFARTFIVRTLIDLASRL